MNNYDMYIINGPNMYIINGPKMKKGRSRDMKQKTIRVFQLQPARIVNGCVEGRDWETNLYYMTEYKIGAIAVLYSKTNNSPNSIRAGEDIPRYDLYFDEDGIPGNMNPDIKKINGWRGTFNDISTDAHGLCRITKIRQLQNGDISVTVKLLEGKE